MFIVSYHVSKDHTIALENLNLNMNITHVVRMIKVYNTVSRFKGSYNCIVKYEFKSEYNATFRISNFFLHAEIFALI